LKGLISIAASGDHCVLATNQEESNSYLLLLCNALGTPIDTKQVCLFIITFNQYKTTQNLSVRYLDKILKRFFFLYLKSDFYLIFKISLRQLSFFVIRG
jgi:hypothetical protein